jgi:hypothetical protein
LICEWLFRLEAAFGCTKTLSDSDGSVWQASVGLIDGLDAVATGPQLNLRGVRRQRAIPFTV